MRAQMIANVRDYHFNALNLNTETFEEAKEKAMKKLKANMNRPKFSEVTKLEVIDGDRDTMVIIYGADKEIIGQARILEIYVHPSES